jgi:hypothetical protein
MKYIPNDELPLLIYYNYNFKNTLNPNRNN